MCMAFWGVFKHVVKNIIFGSFSFQFLSIIILSVRTDRLSDSTYLASHWKHYGGMLAFARITFKAGVVLTAGFALLDVDREREKKGIWNKSSLAVYGTPHGADKREG